MKSVKYKEEEHHLETSKNPWKKFDRIEFNRKVRRSCSGNLHTTRGKKKGGINQERKAKKNVQTGPGDPTFK